jgi:tetratricopeptide (TPR) repeat protein
MLVAHRALQDFAGTPEYMAPEQIQYLPSRASDQYALAILVYEWLTGYPPFMGNQGDILNKHLSIAPASLPRIVPPELAAVLMKALSKNPKDRYPTIQDFASALEQAYNQVLQRTQTPTLVEKPPLPVMNSKTKEQWATEGSEYYAAKRYDEAMAAYTKAMELDSAFALVYHNRGSTYFNLKQYQEALQDYSKSIELDPINALVYGRRGATYSNLKRYEEAIRDYSKALELDPTLAAAYNNRGAAYDVLKNYKQAIADYDRALALDPNDTDVRENRKLALRMLQEEEKKPPLF